MPRRKRPARARQAPNPPSPPHRPAWQLPVPLVLGLLALVALALYGGSLRYPLVFDDYHLHESALRTRYADAASRLQLRWFSDASFGWIYSAFGADLTWQRLANILLHAGVAAALFGFASRLMQATLHEPRARLLAFGGALLFVVHPAAVYGVAYLMQRSIVLATLFCVLALWCVLEGLVRGSRAWYAAAVLAYLLAVSSKEHAVMLPAAAAALAFLVRGPSWRLARIVGFALLPCAAVAVFLAVKSSAVLGTAYEPMARDALAMISREPGYAASMLYPASALNQAALFFRYIGTWLLPWPGFMSIDVRPAFPAGVLDGPYLVGAAAWLAWPCAGAWLLSRRGRAGLGGFALLFPWLLALTELSTIRTQESFVLYRSYLWMSVPIALLPALAGRLPGRALAAGAAAACVVLLLFARERIDTFSTPLKLWNDAVQKIADPRLPYAQRPYVARGLVFLDQGELRGAAADFERAVQINPGSPDGYLGLATTRLRSGRPAEALPELDRALVLDPNYAGAYLKRCVARMLLGRAPQAIADCEKAQQLDAPNHEVWTNSGVVYRELGRAAEAEASYRRALELAPRNPSAHYNYAVLLLDSPARAAGAGEHLRAACSGGLPAACRLLKR